MELQPDDPTGDWTESGVFEVAPGVYRIPLPLPGDGLRAVNVYAILDRDELVLIDSGWAIESARELLVSALRALDRELGDVQRFLVTHVHRDHYSQAIAVRNEFGTRVSLGRGEEPSLRTLAEQGRKARMLREESLLAHGAEPLVREFRAMTAAAPEPDPLDWSLPDDWFEGPGTEQLRGRALDVVPTPGHTQGHVVFVDAPNNLLFAGDHVLPRITPSIGFEVAKAELPLRDYLDSLRLVRGMPDRRLLPAHGSVTGSVHQRVDELLEHHSRRLDDMAGVVHAGASTAYEAARSLTWTRRERKLDELDVFNQFLAVHETAAHLDLLVYQGKLDSALVNSVREYTP
ncbi:glyoxylase-like metal-dependent hydrolase (beta-lactamase superfamily II) [Tamaricihabitans halophyticus]|uniref:Glyoxylase-like metal-dependent hydrolase (Beta-lactamase superfamily II) n=1 Tax=Tamaricihabitans halophyticus TaxID=1262583 RepID=A0A4R2R9P2_9PSEU|nr:MBL fold metallo-hydrolase [Tamaricihabitans halophyticus]TCP56401.1 glyoxylase-like metal-dependent hydrolase (beta-lactamase superfamily II) [Tamaricihabitans halophyticus]